MISLLPLLCLALTVSIYVLAKKLYRKFPRPYLVPLLVAPSMVLLIILGSGISMDDYDRGAGLLSDMIAPATIALAVTLHKHLDVLKQHARAIATGVGVGAIAAILTTAGLARLFGLDLPVAESLASRSATTAVAVTISGVIGGLPTLTAVATMFTGLLGMLLGPVLIRKFSMDSPVARGLLFGTGAHSAGIAKALEYGPETAAVAGVSMVCTAFVTLAAAPWLIGWFQ